MKLLNRYLAQTEKNEQNKNQGERQVTHHANYKLGITPFLAFLRVRPLFLPEQMRNPQPSIEVLDRESVIFKHEHQQGLKSLTKDKLYRCTRTVPPGGKTNSLLQLGILDLVNDSFNGLNQAVFVIGGKDSGKTHTFIGNVGDPGLSFSIASTIFQSKQKHYDQSRVYLSCFSFQNNFKDLLSYTGECLEHRTTYNGAFIPGLSQVECPDMLTYLTFYKTALIVNGKRDINRDFSQAFTLFNPQPEKEIFIIKFTIINQVEEFSENGTVFKQTSADLFMIDTESYESLDKIESKGVNNAMLSFNNCMRTIYEINMGMREDYFVHYEQSPFTSFFREYLGGKSKTFIIGTVSPFSGHLEYSMRTVREVQWAQKSKSNGIKHQEWLLGKMALANEVGYLKIMHNNSILIYQEITKFLKRKNLIEEEEKQKYVQFLGRIFKKFYYINRVCNEKIRRILEMRDQIDEINNYIIEQERSVMKEQLRSPDIKEFFLVKIVPLMYNLVYSKINKAQQNLQKKLKILKSENQIVCRIKKDLKEFIDLFVKKNSLIKTNHQEAIFSFTKTLIDHMNWSQYNCFKSFNHPDKEKLKKNKQKVEKTLEQNFKRIFTSLNVTDYEKYEDKAFAYVGIRLADIQQKHNKNRISMIQHQNMPIIPSHHSLTKDKNLSNNNSNASIKQIEETQQEGNQSLSKIKKDLSSIFDLPSTMAVIKGSGKMNKGYMNKRINYKGNSCSQNSLLENDSDDEEDSDNEDEYEIQYLDNSANMKRKYKRIRKVSKVNQLNHKSHQPDQLTYQSLQSQADYYENDGHDLMYQKKSKKKNSKFEVEVEQNHVPRLNSPKVTIQAKRSEIKINRKINMAHNQINNHYHIKGSTHLPQINQQMQSNQNTLSLPTSEAASFNRCINASDQLTETKPTDHIKILETLSDRKKQSAYLTKDDEENTQMDTITFGIPVKSIKKQQNQLEYEKMTHDQVSEGSKAYLQLSDEEGNEQNSLLMEINTERMHQYMLDNRSETLNSQRSYLPMISKYTDEVSTDKDLLSLNSQSLYYSDIVLKSKFNDKLVVNVNLFKTDLVNYKLPFSIKRIFVKKSNNKLINHHSYSQHHDSQNQNQIQTGFIQEVGSKSVPKMPPKNSIMNRQMQLAAFAIQKQSQNQNNQQKAKNFQAMMKSKSIYENSLEALVINSGSSIQRYSTVNKFFDKMDDGPLLTTKAISIKEKTFMKRQFYAMRKHKGFVYKPNNIYKLQSEIDDDLQLHQ